MLLIIPVITTSSAIAAPKYTPPSTGRQDEESVSSGSRGCDKVNAAKSFHLIVPKDHVGKTTKSHPTFLWYISSKTDVPMQLILQEPEAYKLIFKTRLQPARAGIVALELPSSIPGLEYGKQYNWTVSLICSERHPSRNSYASANIERIKIDSFSSLKTLPPKLADSSLGTSIYAGLGVWYDAIASACTRTENEMCLISQDFTSLLAQVGLGNIVTLERQRIQISQGSKNKLKK